LQPQIAIYLRGASEFYQIFRKIVISQRQVRLGYQPDVDAAKECKSVMKLTGSNFILLIKLIDFI